MYISLPAYMTDMYIYMLVTIVLGTITINMKLFISL